MFFYDCALWSNTELDSVSSTLRYCMTAPDANLEIIRLVARIRRLSSQRLCKNKIFGKVSATRLDVVEPLSLSAIFNYGNTQKSHGAMSGLYGDWRSCTILCFAKNCCTRFEECDSLSW